MRPARQSSMTRKMALVPQTSLPCTAPTMISLRPGAMPVKQTVSNGSSGVMVVVCEARTSGVGIWLIVMLSQECVQSPLAEARVMASGGYCSVSGQLSDTTATYEMLGMQRVERGHGRGSANLTRL